MRKNFNRVFYLLLALCLSVAIAVCSAEAQPELDWPANRTITILNASAVGSPNDLLSREFGRALEYLFPGTVVNTISGSGSGPSFAALFAAPADGNTILSMNPGQMASLHTGLGDDFPFERFGFIGNTQVDPFTIAIPADAPYQTLEELIAYARANPGFTIGGTGTGTLNHLLPLRFSRLADFNFVWLPFAGGSEAVVNLLGGHVNAISTSPTSARPHVEAGTMRMLAVTGHNRMKAEMFSDIPTFIERGYEVMHTQYRGFAIRGDTDPALKQRMSDVLRKATLTDSFVDYMERNYMEDAFMDHAEFTQYVTEGFISIGQMLEELRDN